MRDKHASAVIDAPTPLACRTKIGFCALITDPAELTLGKFPSFDRYSNTLYSLNNCIAIRNTYGSHGGAVDCQVMTFPSISSASSGATTPSTWNVFSIRPLMQTWHDYHGHESDSCFFKVWWYGLIDYLGKLINGQTPSEKTAI